MVALYRDIGTPGGQIRGRYGPSIEPENSYHKYLNSQVKDDKVIGHYRLSESLESEKWCVVESVIISCNYRGLGKSILTVIFYYNYRVTSSKSSNYLTLTPMLHAGIPGKLPEYASRTFLGFLGQLRDSLGLKTPCFLLQ